MTTATQLSRKELETLLLTDEEDGLKLDEKGRLRSAKAEREEQSRPTPAKPAPKGGVELPEYTWD